MRIKIGYHQYHELLSCFVSLLQKAFGSNVISIVLYGSVAREEAGRESDIDLLVIVKKAPSVYRKRLEPILDAICQIRSQNCWKNLRAQELFPEFSVMILVKDEAEENRTIYLDMLENCVILLDKSDFFRRRLEAMRARLKELGSKKVRRNRSWYWDIKPDLKLGETVAL